MSHVLAMEQPAQRLEWVRMSDLMAFGAIAVVAGGLSVKLTTRPRLFDTPAIDWGVAGFADNARKAGQDPPYRGGVTRKAG